MCWDRKDSWALTESARHTIGNAEDLGWKSGGFVWNDSDSLYRTASGQKEMVGAKLYLDVWMLWHRLCCTRECGGCVITQRFRLFPRKKWILSSSIVISVSLAPVHRSLLSVVEISGDIISSALMHQPNSTSLRSLDALVNIQPCGHLLCTKSRICSFPD